MAAGISFLRLNGRGGCWSNRERDQFAQEGDPGFRNIRFTSDAQFPNVALREPDAHGIVGGDAGQINDEVVDEDWGARNIGGSAPRMSRIRAHHSRFTRFRSLHHKLDPQAPDLRYAQVLNRRGKGLQFRGIDIKRS